MDKIRVERFTPNDEVIWDNFIVSENAFFATFLHSRNFLNYHPLKRFVDHSLLFYNNKNNLIAVLPACETENDSKKILFSHKGSTFGGFVIDRKSYKTEIVDALLESFEEYCRFNGIFSAYLKQTSDFFCTEGVGGLLEFLYAYRGYKNNTELNTIVDFRVYKEDILSNFEQGKRTNVNNCLKKNLEFRTLNSRSEIAAMYEILSENLKKYDTHPVHTLEELYDFNETRLKDETEFVGVFDGNVQIAGGMLFKFKESNVLHTQYLCADPIYSKLSPMTFLYFSVIQKAKNEKYNGVSWGISTEDSGKKINWGLTRSKEAFGGRYSLNKTFYKEFV